MAPLAAGQQVIVTPPAEPELSHWSLVRPTGDGYAAAADCLREALGLRTDQVHDAGATIADDTPVIALGNMMDSPFLRRLYHCLDDVTDRAWPGAGGWALRMHRTPLSRRGPVLIVSVSDPQDAVAAATALSRHVTIDQPLPYVHEVHLGQGGDLYRAAARPFMQEPDTPWEDTGGAGDWDYMMVIARMGMAALKTGDGEIVGRFATEVLRFAHTRFYHRRREDPIMIHGFLRHMLIPFALLEYHPAILPAQRRDIVEALLGLLRSQEGAANPRLLEDTEHHRVRQNHATRTALDVFTCGRYFSQVHGLAEAEQWQELAHRFFEPQLQSSKPVEDSWGHQWRATLYNTADFALQAGLDAYVRGPVFRDAAERALLAHSNLEEGPLLYLLMAAAATGDDTYLQSANRWGQERLIERAVADLGGDETGRSWVTGRSARPAGHLTGLQVAPLSPLFFESIEQYAEYMPDGVYERHVSPTEVFDKIAWRQGWQPEDDYLLIDGVSGGSHAYQDANAIVRFTSAGHSWFGGPDYGKWSTASVREHCAVSVVVDGQGPGCESRYARLERRLEIPGVDGVVTELRYPGMALWRRHVVCAEDGWYLCVDEMEALKAGAYLVEGRWNVQGEIEPSAAGLMSRQGQAILTMAQTGAQETQLDLIVDREGPVCHRWTLRTAGDLAPGETLRLSTAWRVQAAPGSGERADSPSTTSAVTERIRLEAIDFGFRVQDTEVIVWADPPPTSSAAALHLPLRPARPGSADHFRVDAPKPWKPAWVAAATAPVSAVVTTRKHAAIGQLDGAVGWIDPQGRVEYALETAEPVRCMAALPDGGLVVGGDDATLRVVDTDGTIRWSYEIQWQPMSWEYWTRLHCGIVSLQIADLDADGEVEIVVGCADRHLYAFRSTGEPLWRTACQWGVPTSLATTTGASGEALVLAGMSQPSIHAWCRVHDGTGEFLHALQRPDIVCWSIPSWMRCLSVMDVDGDGIDEVITGLDTNHRQLIVYRLDGQRLWDADMGSAVTAVTTGDGCIVAGAASGQVTCFDARQGRRLWHRFLVHPVASLIRQGGEIVISLAQGSVVALDRTGQVVRGEVSEVAPGEGIVAAAWGRHVLHAAGSQLSLLCGDDMSS